MKRYLFIALCFLTSCKAIDYDLTDYPVINRTSSAVYNVIVRNPSTRWRMNRLTVPAGIPVTIHQDEYNLSNEESDPLPGWYLSFEFTTTDGKKHEKAFYRFTPSFLRKGEEQNPHIIFVIKENFDVIAKVSRFDKFKNGAYPDKKALKQTVESVYWFRKAAEQGYMDAQTNLGKAYLWGEGIKQDPREAVKWFKKAAAQGDVDGQFYVGYAYDTGKGVSADFSEARKWYSKTAEKGDAKSQYSLGALYYNGEGVPQDNSKAYFWVYLSAVSGVPAAIQFREEIAKKLSMAARAQIEKEASLWKPKTALH